VADLVEITSLQNFIRHHGYQSNGSLVTGEINRFPAKCKGASNRSGWCIPFPNGGGVLGDYTTGEKLYWFPEGGGSQIKVSHEQEQRDKEKWCVERRRREVCRVQNSKQIAMEYWARTVELKPSHPYLARKGLTEHFAHQTFNARADSEFIVIPLANFDGELQAIHRIGVAEKNNKRNLKGSVTKNTCCVIGNETTQVFCVCEGWATAISIHLSTGCQVFFGAALHSLMEITQMIRKRWPRKTIVVCADNDERTQGNPGFTVAKKVADQCGVSLAIPPLPGDFDDLRQTRGMSAVRKLVLRGEGQPGPIGVN
jgi:putative DNA primase/helicase